MPHHRSRHHVPRSDPPAAQQRPHTQYVHLIANGHAALCPTCAQRGCPHARGHTSTLEAARALLGGADGALCRDQQGRWHAYTEAPAPKEE